ncbi:Meiosis-specific transcription factor NDT80 [Candida viswanathii]|uniref:Meiosis-specific transcription factor NDT80 n=1 Tax=Candida viswanathii TaxID=5486 RepID=A0A367YD53_9ASCO|nr:Meiosis-specific transcription factor NDT80 [Candida viswanathii]
MGVRTRSNKGSIVKRSRAIGIRSDPVSYIPHKKSRIAPRSGLQFKVGPPFQPTIQVSSLFINETNTKVIPILECRIDRGFELIGDEWVGYKRNYMSVVSSFAFQDIDESSSILQNHGFCVVTGNRQFSVKRFAIRLVGKSTQDGADVNLIQHTAKRDKGPIMEPPIIPVVPGVIPGHVVIREGANIRNESKIRDFERLFVQDYDSLEILQPCSILQNYAVNENYNKVAKYERIQFASSLNSKKSIYKNKKFILQIQLLAELDDDDTYAVIALSNTPPVSIRANGASRYEDTPKEPKSKSPLGAVSNKMSCDLTFPVLLEDIPEDDYVSSDEQDLMVFSRSCPVFNPFNDGPQPLERLLRDQAEDPELLDPRYYLEKSRVTRIHELTSCYFNETFSSAFFRDSGDVVMKVFEDTKKDYDGIASDRCIEPYLLTNY